MNILVCVSRTPETTAKVEFVENDRQYNSEGVNYIMNPYDEWYALVRGLELVEAIGGEVHIVTVDEASADTVLRKGLAIGAHKAFRIDRKALSSREVAKEISAWVADKGYDLVLTGKETIDYNNGEVGGMLAAYLDLPFFALVNHLEADGNSFKLRREIDGGEESVGLEGPLVLGVTKGIAEQRIPNMKGIMMAKRKPLEVIAPSGVQAELNYAGFEKTSGTKSVKMVDPENMEELVRLLHEEAKVI